MRDEGRGARRRPGVVRVARVRVLHERAMVAALRVALGHQVGHVGQVDVALAAAHSVLPSCTHRCSSRRRCTGVAWFICTSAARRSHSARMLASPGEQVGRAGVMAAAGNVWRVVMFILLLSAGVGGLMALF